MKAKLDPAARWLWMVGYLGIVLVLMACAALGGTEAGVTPSPAVTEVTPEASLRLENGAIEVRQESGEWLTVAGETTFEITGELQSTDPWMVNGNTFATRESTRIDENLEPGERVRVRGVILEDGTWLSHTIERAPAGEPASPAIILIGKVDSIDPWQVSGITLNVTPDTLIGEGIEQEMIVRVEILLLEDGTWEVLSIVPLSAFTDVPGCATVTATVAAVDGNEIQFAGWPVITIGEDVLIESDQGGEATLDANQPVLVVVCASEDGEIRITHIVILIVVDGETPSSEAGEKVLVCHKPDKKGGHTLSISSSAVPAHLGHGDKLGPCP